MMEVRHLRGAVAQRAGWLGELEQAGTQEGPERARLCGLLDEMRSASDLAPSTREVTETLVQEACGAADEAANGDPDVAALVSSLRAELGTISLRLGELWDGFYVLAWITLALAGVALALLAYVRVIRLSQISAQVAQLEQHMGDADRLAVVGTLAAGAAHEINNPLTLILGNLQLVGMRLDSEPGMEEERESLGQAADAVRRISGIVRDLQDAGRPIPERIEPCDLWSSIERSLALATLDFPKSLQVERALEPVPKVLAPAPRLEQVLLNLFVNASHAIRGHDPEDPRLRVRCREETDGRVSVEAVDAAVSANAQGPHMAKPRMLYLSNATELGTVYSLGVEHRGSVCLLDCEPPIARIYRRLGFLPIGRPYTRDGVVFIAMVSFVYDIPTASAGTS